MRAVVRLFILAGLLVWWFLPCECPLFAQDALTLGLTCDPAELCWGDELSVLASCENAGEALAVDLYLAVVLPDGDVFYFPDGSLSAPFMSSVMIPESASFGDVEVFSGEMRPGLDAGEYLWMLIATACGTGDILADCSVTMRLGYDCWEGFSALNAVQSLLLRGNLLYVGTWNGGVAKYDLATGQHVRYGMSDGLSSSEVNDFCVDGDGKIWAATGYWTYDGDWTLTWGGISRLNGTDWSSFYPDYDGYNPYLGSRYGDCIEALAYSATDDAVFAVSRGGELLRVVGDSKQTVGFPYDKMWAEWVCGCPDGSVCVLTRRSQPSKKEPVRELYRLASDTWTKLAHGAYRPVFVASDGSIWCSSGDYGLFRLRDDGSWEEVEELRDSHILKIVEAQGKLWVLTRHRLYVWDGSAWSYEELPVSSYSRALAVSESGTAYVGYDEGILTYRAGVWDAMTLNCPYYIPFTYYMQDGVSDAAFRGSDTFIVRWPYVSSFDGTSWAALPPRRVFDDPYYFWGDASLFIDSAGTLWEYGLHWWGLELAALRANQWEVFVVRQWSNSLSHLSMAQDASGALWLYAFTRDYPKDPVFIYEDSSGLQRFDSIKAAVEKRYDILCASEPKTDVWLLDVERDIVWVTLGQPEGSYDFRVVPASYNGQTWVIYEGPLPGGGLIRAFRGYNRSPLDIDDGGYIWTLTDLGLCRLDRSGVWFEPSGRTDGLAPPLHVDNYGNIWLAIKNKPYSYSPVEHRGLARYDIDEGAWRDFTERDVPICDWIHNIRSAPNGDVWFCTWEGVTRYSQGPR